MIVSTPNQDFCEGFLCLFPSEFTKDNSSGLLVACGSSFVLVLMAPLCRARSVILLAREPPSECIATTWSRLPASNRTMGINLVSHCLIGILY